MCFLTGELDDALRKLGFIRSDIAAMQKAFESAARAAAVTEDRLTTRRRMADAILAAFARGERDPRRLRRVGLDSLFVGVSLSARRFDTI